MSLTSKYRVFIWDFDGTLYDTYPHTVRAYVETLSDYGIVGDAAGIERVARRSLGELQRDLEARYALPREYFAKVETRALEYALISEDIESVSFLGAHDFLTRESGERPGCVILDIRMPGMSGTELFDELIRQAYTHPVIFLSGHGFLPGFRRGSIGYRVRPGGLSLYPPVYWKCIE